MCMFVTGRLQSAVISFTELHSDPNSSPVEFTLSCLSWGGPATTVVWQRNGSTISEDANHVTSQIVVSTSTNATYENRLRVSGRETGNYRCNVSSNRIDIFGTTGSSVLSPSFTVVGKSVCRLCITIYRYTHVGSTQIVCIGTCM